MTKKCRVLRMLLFIPKKLKYLDLPGLLPLDPQWVFAPAAPRPPDIFSFFQWYSLSSLLSKEQTYDSGVVQREN
jgi:hypothetical protein